MWNSIVTLAKRVNVPVTASTTPSQYAEMQRDLWSKSAKYGYGFVYFALVLLVTTSLIRFWHIWGDKMRVAYYREHRLQLYPNASTSDESGPPSAGIDASNAQFYPAQTATNTPRRREWLFQRYIPLQKAIALMRCIFYRPIPVFEIGNWEIVFPSLAVTVVVLAALIFVVLYCFVPQPLYYWSIALGSPPLAIRAGMLAVAMVPWIVALATKANIITMLT